jgi:hypothetical protein
VSSPKNQCTDRAHESTRNACRSRSAALLLSISRMQTKVCIVMEVESPLPSASQRTGKRKGEGPRSGAPHLSRMRRGAGARQAPQQVQGRAHHEPPSKRCLGPTTGVPLQLVVVCIRDLRAEDDAFDEYSQPEDDPCASFSEEPMFAAHVSTSRTMPALHALKSEPAPTGYDEPQRYPASYMVCISCFAIFRVTGFRTVSCRCRNPLSTHRTRRSLLHTKATCVLSTV